MPLRFAVCVLLFTPFELSVTVKVADRAPVAPGLNVTLITQFDPTASELPQVLVSAKSLLFAPVMVIPVMLRVAVPLFESVTPWALLVVPTS